MKINFPKKTAALFTATFVIFASSLLAQDTPSALPTDFWQGPPDSGPNDNWFNNGNWSGGAPPIVGQDAQINNTGTARISTHSPSAVALNVFLGFASADSGNLRIVNGGILTLGDSIKVGESGTGTLGIRDSGALHDVTGVIGNLSGSDGTADVQDTAVWTNSNALFVGDQGTGRLRVMDQAVVSTNNNIIVGRASSGIGRLDVQGTFSINTNNFNVISGSDMHIGQAGDGRMDIHDGGRVLTNGDAFVGTNNGGTGVVNVGGDGPNSEAFWRITPGGTALASNARSDWANSIIAVNSPAGSNGDLTVGDNSGSDGTLRIHDGGNVSADGNVFIGKFAGSMGRVSIDGTGGFSSANGFGSVLFSSGALGVFVGGNSGGPGGDGALRLTNGGTVQALALTVWGPGSGNKGLLEVDSTYVINVKQLTFDGGRLRFLDDTDFTNNATLGNTQSPDGIFVDTNGTTSTISGVLSGPGGLVKRDDGTLIIPAGTNDTYTGNTRVREGTLQLDGSITSNTFVESAGTLTGTGLINGNLHNDGVVAPGDSPGTLTVVGNYVQTSNGDFSVEVGGLDSGVTADLLTMGGTASLAGSIHVIRFDDFNPVPGDRVTVLHTDGGRGGSEFDTTVPVGWLGLIQPFVDYPNDSTVDVVFELTSSFASQGTTRNEICVGENLDAAVFLVNDNEAAHNLIGIIGQVPVADLPEAFNLLAPEELASIYEISFQHGIMQMATYRQRMDDLRAGARGYCEPPTPMVESRPDGKQVMDGKTALPDKTVAPVETCPDKRWGMFATGYGQGVNVDDDEFNNVHGYDIMTGGFSTGFDALVTRNFAIGIGGGYAQSTADLVNDGRVDVETGYVAAYATAFFGGFYVDGAASGGWSTYDTSRLGFGGFEDGETEGSEFNGIIGAGYDWRTHCWTIGPFATFHYTYVQFDSFDEHGTSIAPLHFPDQNQDAERGAIGLKVAYDMTKGNIIFRPEVRAAFQHEFNNTDYAIDWSFRDISDEHICQVFGPSTGRDSALIDAGFSLILGKCHNVSAFAFYSGNIGRDNDTRHGANGGLRLSF